MVPQYKLFSKCTQAYTYNGGILYIVLCLNDLEDKPDDDFKVEEGNFFFFFLLVLMLYIYQ